MWYFRRFRSSLRSGPALVARTWGPRSCFFRPTGPLCWGAPDGGYDVQLRSTHPILAARVVQPALLPDMARATTPRETRTPDETMIGQETIPIRGPPGYLRRHKQRAALKRAKPRLPGSRQYWRATKLWRPQRTLCVSDSCKTETSRTPYEVHVARWRVRLGRG
jgi:hypothetical protein